MTASYFEGLNHQLLALVPNGNFKVVELGCANGRLGEEYLKQNPGY